MNDETFEIEASAIEASLDEDVEDAAQMDADMSFADIEAEISDPQLEEASSPVQEDERADQKVDLGEMDLRAEIAKLREEIAGVNNKKTEFLCGIKEFAEIFGASALAEIPESVWQSAANIPLPQLRRCTASPGAIMQARLPTSLRAGFRVQLP